MLWIEGMSRHSGVILAAMLILSSACGAPRRSWQAVGIRVPSVTDLYDLADLGPAPVIVPNRRWEISDENGWYFRGAAELIIHVSAGSTEELGLFLLADEKTLDHHFMISLDDERPTGPRKPSPSGDTIWLGGVSAKPGVHRLRVRRYFRADQPLVRKEINNCFARIEVRRRDGSSSLIDPRSRSTYDFVASFLSVGVTGVERHKSGGALVRGARTITAGLGEGSWQTFTARLQASGGRAKVTATCGPASSTLSVGDGGSRHLRLDLSEGCTELSLTSDGEPDAFVLWGAPSLVPARADLRPPVVILSLDTTRRDALAPYGGDPSATPSITELARHSTTFTHAWAAAPWTLPSHASIFTGLYPSHHGAGVTRDRVPLELTTLAEHFRTAGYLTAGFAGGELMSSKFGTAQGFAQYLDPVSWQTPGDELTAAVEELLGRLEGTPLFLFVNYFDPHAPYLAPSPFAERFGVPELAAALEDEPGWQQVVRGAPAAWGDVVAGRLPVVPGALEWVRSAYLAEVAAMDHQIGRLLTLLQDHGLYERALIVLVADHGELLGENGFFSHGFRLDAELTSIPLLIKWPQQKTPRTTPDLVSHVDLYATILSLLDSHPDAGDGVALAADGKGHGAHEWVRCEEHQCRVHPMIRHMRIAPHLLAIQRLERRRIEWKGGLQCQRLEAGEWLEVECDGPRSNHPEVPVTSRHETISSEPNESMLTRAERQALEALSYLE